MCSQETIQKLLTESERKMEKYVDDRFYKWHKDNTLTFSNLMGEVKNLIANGFAEYNKEMKQIHDWKIAKEVTDKQSKEDIKSIKDSLARIMWVVIIGVIMAGLGLILK